MNSTTFAVRRMDCAAEEQLVRMALAGDPGVHRVDVDLTSRSVVVLHDGPAQAIASRLAPLHLGVSLLGTAPARPDDLPAVAPRDEGRTLRAVLAINAVMFLAELTAAYVAQSAALLADSLDMLADAAVYGVALYGVRRSRARQLTVARASGILQMLLAGAALAEVGRRLAVGSEPDAPLMVLVATAALAANVTSLWLLARHRRGGAHMRASWIFTANDVIANLGVIVAAGLVRVFDSAMPDLVVGTAIALVVFLGAVRILRLSV